MSSLSGSCIIRRKFINFIHYRLSLIVIDNELMFVSFRINFIAIVASSGVYRI